MRRSYALGILAKPKVIIAMLALFATGYISSWAGGSAENFRLVEFLVGLTAVGIAVAGANALNCYLDRDIDLGMVRTRGRVEAMEIAGVSGTLGFSLLLLFGASIISMFLGTIPFAIYVVGSSFYIVAYTALLKRKTMLNVLSTAPSVASPAWFGWYLGGSPLYPAGLLFGILVALWGPLHLWSLAYIYSKDYSSVNVPMMPNQVSKDTAIKVISVTLMALVAVSYTLVPYAMSSFYIIGITCINAFLLAIGILFYYERTNARGYLVFKLSAPYIVLALLTFTIDQFFF